jgi:hypothetical protein
MELRALLGPARESYKCMIMHIATDFNIQYYFYYGVKMQLRRDTLYKA